LNYSEDYALIKSIKDAQAKNDKKAFDVGVVAMKKKWEHLINKMYNLYRNMSQQLGLVPSFDDYLADANTALMKAIHNADLSKVPDPEKWCFYAPLWGYLKREISSAVSNQFKETREHVAFSLDDTIDDENGASKSNLVAATSDPYQDFERNEFKKAFNEAINESFVVFSPTQKKLYGFITSNEKVSKKRQMQLLNVTAAEYKVNLKQVQSTIKVNLARACNRHRIPQIKYQM
jgi:hypothetical protein